MFKNNIKLIFRNFWKNKTFSTINLFGLTIGLTSCILIALYIQHELSYDNFQTRKDRIARVIMDYSFDGSNTSNQGNFTSVRVAPVLKKNFPEVEGTVRMSKSERVVRYNDKLLNEKRFAFADPSFFTLFDFPLLEGNSKTALAEANNVIVTETTAKKYFGNENAVGKIITVGSDTALYQVTGVMRDCPSNSQIKFDFLASFSSLKISQDKEESYWNANYTTFLLLKDRRDISSLQAKLPSFMKKEMEGKGASLNFLLEPFDTIHLYSPFDGFEPNNSITYIYIIAAVALLILIIACFTYINLSTARSIERAKEVGVRKVIGAEKKQIFWQFISESAVLCLASVILAFAVAALVLPYFNQLTDKSFQISSLFSVPFLLIALFIATIVSFAAGSYPALILSGFQPVKVLKGAFKNASSGQRLRKSLIVFQFIISVFLIVSTFIIKQQLYFIQHKKLGYERDHLIVLPISYRMESRLPLIKQEFKSNADVLNVSHCYNSPVDIEGGYSMRSSVMPENSQISVTANPIDNYYLNTVGLKLVAGNDLNEQDLKDAADSLKNPEYHFILNESAAKELGWTAEQAIGKRMFLDATRPGIVKGVIKDFNFKSLHTPIKPLVLFPETAGQFLLVKMSGKNLSQSISFIKTKWESLVPERPFEYRFVDEDYNKMYNAELRLGKIMSVFSTIAIVLACLGLFGLSAYAAQQRTKEIGVRKVLGATVTNIVLSLSKDFIKLAAIAIVIAFPFAWWAMHSWLQNYEYRVNIEWWVFVATGIVILLIALLTVSFQSIKAALANPVKSLRSE